jgi:hypothetical protein
LILFGAVAPLLALDADDNTSPCSANISVKTLTTKLYSIVMALFFINRVRHNRTDDDQRWEIAGLCRI